METRVEAEEDGRGDAPVQRLHKTRAGYTPVATDADFEVRDFGESYEMQPTRPMHVSTQ